MEILIKLLATQAILLMANLMVQGLNSDFKCTSKYAAFIEKAFEWQLILMGLTLIGIIWAF